MFILRLFITGLIAFVPTEDGRQLYVLLPNAAQMTGAMPAHYAMLSFDPRDRSESSDRNDWAKIVPKINGSRVTRGAGWLLDGERLSLGRASALPLSLAHTRPAATTLARNGQPAAPASEAEGWDFDWVPKLGAIAHIDATVDPKLLKAPSGERLAGLLTLDQGYVRTYSLARHVKEDNTEGDALFFGFGPRNAVATTAATCSQVLADMVVIEIPITTPTVRLEAQTFGGGQASFVVLKPRAGRDSVDVLLANLPAAALQPGERALPQHFVHYYDLLATPPSEAAKVTPTLCKSLARTPTLAPKPVAIPSLYKATISELIRAPLARPICTPAVLDPTRPNPQ